MAFSDVSVKSGENPTLLRPLPASHPGAGNARVEYYRQLALPRALSWQLLKIDDHDQSAIT